MIRRGLHLQADALQTATGQFNLPASGQQGAAARRLNECVLARIDGRPQNHHIAATGQDVAQHRHRASSVHCRTVAKAQPSSQGISICHAQG